MAERKFYGVPKALGFYRDIISRSMSNGMIESIKHNQPRVQEKSTLTSMAYLLAPNFGITFTGSK